MSYYTDKIPTQIVRKKKQSLERTKREHFQARSLCLITHIFFLHIDVYLDADMNYFVFCLFLKIVFKAIV